MELTVARLKVLGETDIADLDKKIADYKASNDPTILNKDLETIQWDIQQKHVIYRQLVSEMAGITQRQAAAIQQREKHNTDYANLEAQRNKIVAEIDTLFIQHQDYTSDYLAKKAEVDKCCSELANAKSKLAETIEAHKTQDTEYQEKLKTIRESVARVEDEIHEHRQRAYQRYLDYELAVKEISLDAITCRNPVNSSFAEMVPDLLQILARNMGNFVKVREFYKVITSKWVDDYHGKKHAICGVHFNICDKIKKYLMDTQLESPNPGRVPGDIIESNYGLFQLQHSYQTGYIYCCSHCGYQTPCRQRIIKPTHCNYENPDYRSHINMNHRPGRSVAPFTEVDTDAFDIQWHDNPKYTGF